MAHPLLHNNKFFPLSSLSLSLTLIIYNYKPPPLFAPHPILLILNCECKHTSPPTHNLQMASSHILDSGKMHGARSNFSQTCNLLSQYLKEKGSFRDLNLCLTPASDKGAPTETMNLLSMIEKSDSRNPNLPPAAAFAGVKEETRVEPEAVTAPMTIFYAGQVIVFNDFPAEKAKEIMAFASAAQKRPTAVNVPPVVAQKPAVVKPGFASAQSPLDSDLPIARKNSLSRFLEKRRDRISANAPYPAAASAAPKQAKEEEAWLGLGPQLPFQIQRN